MESIYERNSVGSACCSRNESESPKPDAENTARLESLANEMVAEVSRSRQRTGLARYSENAQRWWWILRYHRKEQLARRLKSVLLNRLPWLDRRKGLPDEGDATPELREGGGWQKLLGAKIAERDPTQAEANVHRILNGRFRFLNTEITFDRQIDWRMAGHPGAPHLWRFHLHYQEYLLDFLARSDNAADSTQDAAWELVCDWIQGNSPTDPNTRHDAWHPFCISRRLPVWCLLWNACPPPEALRRKVSASMYAQASYLRTHLEMDLGGNHLLENARGLAFAGAFFGGAEGDELLHAASQLFHAELPQQVLESGEHFERSPMYHSLMLGGVLDVRDLTETVNPSLAALCNETGKRMARFLKSICHPDGQISLLGDSAFKESPPPIQLVQRALENLEDDGENSLAGATQIGSYWQWMDGGDFLLFDAGPVAPDHLPAHGHSDLLNIEASVGGHRMITDSGVFNYADDDMRQYCRSTRAHNVLQVDDQEQCDVWSRFRMGRRGWPSPMKSGTTHGFSWVMATHNAYRHLGGMKVGRWIACRPEGPWIIFDWAIGKGRHRFANRLHLHPDVEVMAMEKSKVSIQLHECAGTMSLIGSGELSLGGSWYCPEFGDRAARPVLEAAYEGELPFFTVWCWNPEGCSGNASMAQDAKGALTIVWRDAAGESCWLPFDHL